MALSKEEIEYLDSFVKAGTNKENCELFTKDLESRFIELVN